MYPNQYPYQNAASAVPFARQLQYVKDFLKRPITYVIAGLLTIQTVWIFISSLIRQDTSDFVDGYYAGGYVAGAVIAIIPLGLLVLGAWLVCTKSAKADPLSTPSAGLTIIKVIAIILMVLLCLVFVIALIVLIGLAAAGSYADPSSLGEFSYYLYAFGLTSESISAIIGLIIFIVLAAFIFLLLVLIALLRFISSLKSSMSSPLLKSGGSIMLAVLFIMSAVGSLITLFSGTWTQTISSIFSLALGVCLAVLGITYNTYVKTANAQISAEMNPNQGYPGAPVPPQPPVYGTQYPQQPVNTQYPSYPQQSYTQPGQQPYANPYTQSDAATPAPSAPAQTRYCPACGAPASDPNQTNCGSCGYKF